MLNTITHEIDLNMSQPCNFQYIHIMQYDYDAEYIKCNLYDGNKPYIISCTKDSIIVKCELPDGKEIESKVESIDNNSITFKITDKMTQVKGDVFTSLSMVDTNGKKSPFPFIIKVIKAPEGISDDDIYYGKQGEYYANLSKSYAIGTGNEMRENDDTDNSKYYYEQVKNLINSNSFKNANILYYETYTEFKKDLDAGNIDNETLIGIKENSVNNSTINNEFKDKKLVLFLSRGRILYSDDLKNWTFAGINEDSALIPRWIYDRAVSYCLAYGNNRLFCADMDSANSDFNIYYTIYDFKEGKNNIWSPPVYQGSLGENDKVFRPVIAYGNNHIIAAKRTGCYITDDNAIDQASPYSSFTGFQKMNGIDKITRCRIAYGNDIFVLTNGDGNSYYTSDYKNWIKLHGKVSSNDGNLFFEDYLLYGNGIFIHFDRNRAMSSGYDYDTSILKTNNISNGWENIRLHNIVLNDLNIPSKYNAKYLNMCSMAFDNISNKFIFSVCFTNENKVTCSGFLTYDGTDFQIYLYNRDIYFHDMCMFYNGIFYGFDNNSHWIAVEDITTEKYIDYGEVSEFKNWYPSNSYLYEGIPINNYAIIDVPLKDIDNITT